MRRTALFSLCLLSSVSFAQDTSVHVTYSTRAARASEVVKQLGQLAKVNLQTNPQLEGEVLVISVKDQPLSAVMTRIATVTSGEWKQEGSVYRLIANQNVRTLEERAELAKRVADIRKIIRERYTSEQKRLAALEKLAAKNKPSSKPTPKGKSDDKAKTETKAQEEVASGDGAMISLQEQARFGNTSIDEMTITHLLMGIDPTVIAQVGSGDRIVFSTDPNRMQRGLGSDANEIVNNFILRHNTEVATMPAETPDEATGVDPEQMGFMRDMMKRRMSKIGQVSKALLIIKKAGNTMYSFDDVEFRLFDSKGAIAFSSTSNLSMGDMQVTEAPASDVAASPANPKQPAPSGPKTPIELSEDSKALIASVKGLASGNYKLTFTPELRRKLFLPNIYDPLSFIQTDELLAYAKLSGRPLVADVPDEASSDGMGIGGGDTPTYVEAISQNLKDGKVMVAVPDESFTVVKPVSPVKSRAIRVDRLALASLMRAVDEKGVPTLDDMAEFAMHSPNPREGGITTGYLMMFVPGGMLEGISGMTSWDMLRLYGSLSTETRSTLINGGRVPFNSLNASQKLSLERMTYGSDSRLSVDDGTKKPSDELPIWMSMMGNMFGGNDYRDEATEVAPNGIPGDGYVDLKGTTESFASPQGGSESPLLGMLGILGPDEMALFKMMKETKGAEQISGMLPPLGKLKIGQRSVMNFNFHLLPQVSVKQTLRDHRFPNNALLVAETSLPDDFQKQIADRMKILQHSPFASMGGMFGGEKIHP